MLSPTRVFKAFTYTCKGLQSAWKTEAAFRDDLILVLIMQLSCIWLQPSQTLWLFLLVANILLLVTELLNTGLEYLADFISTDHHALLGQAKDVGSAGVFLILILNIIIMGIIIFEKLS